MVVDRLRLLGATASSTTGWTSRWAPAPTVSTSASPTCPSARFATSRPRFFTSGPPAATSSTPGRRATRGPTTLASDRSTRPTLSRDSLTQLATAVRAAAAFLPVVVAGVTVQRIPQVIAARAHDVAVVGNISQAPDPGQAARRSSRPCLQHEGRGHRRRLSGSPARRSCSVQDLRCPSSTPPRPKEPPTPRRGWPTPKPGTGSRPCLGWGRLRGRLGLARRMGTAVHQHLRTTHDRDPLTIQPPPGATAPKNRGRAGQTGGHLTPFRRPENAHTSPQNPASGSGLLHPARWQRDLPAAAFATVAQTETSGVRRQGGRPDGRPQISRWPGPR